jgi:membrane-bound inhibitor of C-type lysozyme
VHIHILTTTNALICTLPWLVMATLLALTGCTVVQPMVTVLPSEIAYRCMDGSMLQVRRAPDARSAQVLYDGRTITLPRADSAVQEKYSNDVTTLYLDGEKALLTSNAAVLGGQCVSVAPLPVTPQMNQLR